MPHTLTPGVPITFQTFFTPEGNAHDLVTLTPDISVIPRVLPLAGRVYLLILLDTQPLILMDAAGWCQIIVPLDDITPRVLAALNALAAPNFTIIHTAPPGDPGDEMGPPTYTLCSYHLDEMGRRAPEPTEEGAITRFFHPVALATLMP